MKKFKTIIHKSRYVSEEVLKKGRKESIKLLRKRERGKLSKLRMLKWIIEVYQTINHPQAVNQVRKK